MKYNSLKFGLAAVVSVLFVCANLILPVRAEEPSDSESDPDPIQMINAVFDSKMTPQTLILKTPYSDSFFCAPASQYNHQLCKASLGLMASSTRLLYDAEDCALDSNAIQFLKDGGFSDIVTYDYDKPDGRYTVANTISHKTITDKDGPFELIAIGIDGHGYTNEWESNFDIGTDTVHEGFADSSQKVYEHFLAYVEDHHLSGRMKVWITGFSRAAAISNVLGARLTDSDRFTVDDVYVYTFATPRTTKDPKEGQYPNIFNIVGSTDPVPMVPFRDWGYDRYGTTFYTLAQETDSSWYRQAIDVSDVYWDLTGTEYTSIPEMNARIRLIMEYLYGICPTNEIYARYLQEPLISIWEDPSLKNLLKQVEEISENKELINEDNQDDADGLMNFIMGMGADYVLQSGGFRSLEDEPPAILNLIREHHPEIYIAWIYSAEEPETIFSTKTAYTRLTIHGDVSLNLYDGENGTLLQTLYSDGSQEYYDDNLFVFAKKDSGQTVIILPRDRAYRLEVCSEKEQEVSLLEISFRKEELKANAYYSQTESMKAGESLSLDYSQYGSGEIESGIKPDYKVENTQDIRNARNKEEGDTFVNLEQGMFRSMSWKKVVLLIAAGVILTAAAVILIITVLVCYHHNKVAIEEGFLPKTEPFFFLPLLFMILAYALYVFCPIINSIRTGRNWGLVCGTAIAVLTSLSAWIYLKNCRSDLRDRVFVGVVILSIGIVMQMKFLNIAPFVESVGFLFLIWGYLQKQKPLLWQIVITAVLGVLVCLSVLLYYHPRPFIFFYFCIYYLSSLTATTLSFLMPRRFRTGTLLLFIHTFAVLSIYLTGATNFQYWLCGLLYLAGISYLIAGLQKPWRKKMIQEEVTEKPSAEGSAA